jgi:transcriptional regulator with XRE-family HTH domain
MEEPMSQTVLDELSLIPPRRLGILLQQRRRAFDLTIDDMARRSGGRLLVSDLDSIERGLRPIDDEMAAAVARLYRVEAGTIAPQRSRLVIDVNEGVLYVGDTTGELPAQATPQLVLGRYLALVQLLRAWTPGRPLPLRTDDLAVLGDSLGLSSDTVERQLLDLLERGHSVEGLARLRRRLVIPAAGLLVGTTVVGALVLVRVNSSEPGAETERTASPAAPGPLEDPASSGVPTDTRATEPIEADQSTTEPSPDVVDDPIVAQIGDPLRIEGQPAVGTDAILAEPQVVTPTAAPSDVVSSAAAKLVGDRAESAIAYPWRSYLPGWTVAYVDADVVSGNTNIPTQTITVGVAPGATSGYVSEVLAHELGHAIDVSYLRDADRARWLEARGATGIDWWPDGGPGDFDVGAGDFAEAVAAWLVGSSNDSEVAGPFTTEQLDLIAELVP